jgi:hypothetical protein
MVAWLKRRRLGYLVALAVAAILLGDAALRDPHGIFGGVTAAWMQAALTVCVIVWAVELQRAAVRRDRRDREKDRRRQESDRLAAVEICAACIRALAARIQDGRAERDGAPDFLIVPPEWTQPLYAARDVANAYLEAGGPSSVRVMLRLAAAKHNCDAAIESCPVAIDPEQQPIVVETLLKRATAIERLPDVLLTRPAQARA